MIVEVIKVIDGDTFEVSPGWKWEGKTGNIIRAIGYDTPEQGELGYEDAKNRLEELILGKKVEIKNPIRITYGRLL